MAPTGFQSNLQAAQDNYFMAGAKGERFTSNEAVRNKVLEEYSGLYHVLAQDAGIKVPRLIPRFVCTRNACEPSEYLCDSSHRICTTPLASSDWSPS
eukprot:1192398-Prorocentrum_minimum.AAC.12